MGSGTRRRRGILTMSRADPELVVACVNSLSSVTASGSAEALQAVQDVIGSRAFSGRLVVKAAYHNLFTGELAKSYLDSLGGIREDQGEPRGTVKMFS